MRTVSGAYLAILWIPLTPEKILTVIIAMFLLKKLFPKDEKTLGILREISKKVRVKRQEKRLRKTRTKTARNIMNEHD